MYILSPKVNIFFKRYKTLSLPAKAAIWFTICNFILKGISFISGPIFTRILPTDEYGIQSIFLSYEQLILIFATWEIQLGAYTKGLFKYRDDVALYTTATQALTNILTIACFTIIFLFNGLVTKATKMRPPILALLFVYLIVQPSYTLWLNRKRKAYDYRASVSVTLIYSIINVVIPITALLVFNKTANIKFGATLIGSSVICLLFYFRYANYWVLPKYWNKVKIYWIYNIRFEGPLVLHSLSYLILSQADRVMISHMVGDSQAAFYSVAYSIAGILSIFQSSVNQALQPWRYQMLEEKNYSSIKRVTNWLLVGFCTLIIAFLFIVPECMQFLFTADYIESLWCIPPIAASIFFMFLYTIFVNIEEYYEKTKYVVYVSVFCGVINIILNYIFIQIFGYIACAYTTLFSYMLFAAGHYFFMRKTLQSKEIKEDVVDSRAIKSISGCLILVSILVIAFYNLPIIRYSLLLILCSIAVNYRKRIVSVYTQLKGRQDV